MGLRDFLTRPRYLTDRGRERAQQRQLTSSRETRPPPRRRGEIVVVDVPLATVALGVFLGMSLFVLVWGAVVLVALKEFTSALD